LSIDVSAAKSQPGVIDVLTGGMLKSLHPYYGHGVKDHPLIAISQVRFVGEPVAAVIAENGGGDRISMLTPRSHKERLASTKRILPMAPSAVLTISRARQETSARRCTWNGEMSTRPSLRRRIS